MVHAAKVHIPSQNLDRIILCVPSFFNFVASNVFLGERFLAKRHKFVLSMENGKTVGLGKPGLVTYTVGS